MIGPSFFDDIDTDFCGDFLDHIDDLFDFPTEDIASGEDIGNTNCYNGGFQDIVWPPPANSSVSSDSVFSGTGNYGGISEMATELSIPHEDIAQLEWLSNFVEDSFSPGSITLDQKDDINKDSHQFFHTSSPVSVLESSSSCSEEKTIPVSPVTGGHGRARSKRPRPASFNPRPVITFISPTPETSPELENFAESHPSKKILKFVSTQDKNKKKKKLSLSPSNSTMEVKSGSSESISIRKCLHCEITKTPQWRAGPMGPKTLCNACGVRHKSGRLFPEYRPAASPTFVASLHSNSHKKVIEMRTKVCQKTSMAGITLATVPTVAFLAEKEHSG